MHDTACCFGYTSDSSRTARKRAGTLGWAGLRPYHATSSTRADSDATSVTAPGPSCGRARCRSLRAGQDWAGRVATSATSPGPLCGWGGAHCALSLLAGVGRCPVPISQWLWVSAGLPVGAPDRRHASPLISPQGAAVTEQWGGARAGAAAGGSPSVPFKGLRARGAGPITGTSAGLECCVHQIASSVRLRRRVG
jgi:hypothetical protein